MSKIFSREQQKTRKERLIKDIKTYPKKKEKYKKQQNDCERYTNLFEDGRERLVEYRKTYLKMWKSASQ